MERTEKNVNVQTYEKMLLVIFNDDDCQSLSITDQNSKFILIELEGGIGYKYSIIKYYINKYKHHNINLN